MKRELVDFQVPSFSDTSVVNSAFWGLKHEFCRWNSRLELM